jgi:hypothetical protein
MHSEHQPCGARRQGTFDHNVATQTRVPSVSVDHEHCAACGFDGGAYDDASLLAALRGLGSRWRELLASEGTLLRVRPEPEVWSALEYAAHSRDITALHVFGVEQALTLDEPVFPAIAADELIESAVAAYTAADVGEVLDALEQQADRLAQLADDAGPESWSRGLTIGAERTEVRRLLEHALHDSQHHLIDVEHGFSRLRHE